MQVEFVRGPRTAPRSFAALWRGADIFRDCARNNRMVERSGGCPMGKGPDVD
jgi:hypothetical protein